MITVKGAVNLSGLRSELVLALVIADQVYRSHGHELVITSALDGKHGRGSLHYVGQAVDLRTRDLPASLLDSIRLEISARLGPQYDVVAEADHLHVEFQPK